MSKSDYEYLLSLPLVLHLPSEHAFLVHAGLLPYDPTLSITSKRQPLSHLPRIPSRFLGGPVPALRNAQELAILEDIKQNTNPWVVLNIRNVRKDHTVSRSVADRSILDAPAEPEVDQTGRPKRVKHGQRCGMKSSPGVSALNEPRWARRALSLAIRLRWSMVTPPPVD